MYVAADLTGIFLPCRPSLRLRHRQKCHTLSLIWVPTGCNGSRTRRCFDLCGKPLGSPLLSVAKLAEHAAELTPASEQLANASLRALLLPIPLPSLMDKDDAKAFLDQAAEKMVTRAAKKRAANAAAAAEREHAKKRNLGEARRAWREKIAARPPTSARVVYGKTGKRVS